MNSIQGPGTPFRHYPEQGEGENVASYQERLGRFLIDHPDLLPWGSLCESFYQPDPESLQIRPLDEGGTGKKDRSFRYLLLFRQVCGPGCCAPGNSEGVRSATIRVELDGQGDGQLIYEGD